jgi:hypothetical protein
MTIGYPPNNFTTLANNLVNYTFSNSQTAPNDFALFQTHDPWGGTVVKDAITGNAHTFTVFTPAQLAGFAFSDYRVIVLNWDDTFLTDFLADYTAAIPALEAYVNAGGVVWVQGSIQGGPGDSFPFPFGGQANHDLQPVDRIVDFASPIVAGVPDPIVGNFASHADDSGLPAGAHIVVAATDPTGPPTIYDLRPGGGCAGTPTPTPTATPGGCTINGSIDTNSPIQTGRLFRSGFPQTCPASTTCSTFDTLAHHYNAYTFTNMTGATQCVNIDTNTACTGTNFIFTAAYLGSFDPNNICTNWIGDSGSSPNPDQAFQVSVDNGQTFVVVVSEVTPNAGCPAYTVTITPQIICGGGTPTPTPTPTCTPGGSFRVLIAYADIAGPPAELQAQILAEPGVTAVDLFDAFSGTPTLGQLQAYNIVFAFSNNFWSDATAMGNVLADYEDGGGVVVVGTFAYDNRGGWLLQGRWVTDGYTPFNSTSSTNFTSNCANITNPGHPLMQGVSGECAFYRNPVTLTAGATSVAMWTDDSSPAVAFQVHNGHTAVGFNAYLGTVAQPLPSADWGRTIVNAGRWLGGGGCGPTPTPTATPTPATPTPTPTPATPTPTPTPTSATPTPTPTPATPTPTPTPTPRPTGTPRATPTPRPRPTPPPRLP